jgi:hypothetical protein
MGQNFCGMQWNSPQQCSTCKREDRLQNYIKFLPEAHSRRMSSEFLNDLADFAGILAARAPKLLALTK